MKSFSLGLVALSLSVSMVGYAAGVAPPPPPSKHFIVGVGGFFPRASDTQLHFGTVQNEDTSGNNINRHMLIVKPDFHAGWSAHLGYFFNPYDYIMGEYNYFSESNTDGEIVSGVNTLVPVPEVAVPLSSSVAYTTAQATVKHKYQNASIVVGHMWGSGGGFLFSVFGGGKWASLRRNFDVDYLNGTVLINQFNSVNVPNSSLNERSKVNAFGPVMGWWGRYLFKGTEMNNVPGTGFALNVKMSFAFLMGSVDAHQVISAAQGLNQQLQPLPNLTVVANADTGTRIIPNLNAKLGISYTFPLNGFSSVGPMKVVLGAGYRIDYYFNAYSRIPGGLAIFSQDLGFQGPYADLTVMV